MLQEIRIKQRWDSVDLKNEALKKAKQLIKHTNHKCLIMETLENNFWRERSWYLLYKASLNWTKNQYERSEIVFNEYPDIKIAFNLAQGLRSIFNTAKSIGVADAKLAHWYKNVEGFDFRFYNTIVNTITVNYKSILNYFINRSANASVGSFKAKIKAFRAQFRGVKNIEFSLNIFNYNN